LRQKKRTRDANLNSGGHRIKSAPSNILVGNELNAKPSARKMVVLMSELEGVVLVAAAEGFYSNYGKRRRPRTRWFSVYGGAAAVAGFLLIAIPNPRRMTMQDVR
jgi:hypothetical protein